MLLTLMQFASPATYFWLGVSSVCFLGALVCVCMMVYHMCRADKILKKMGGAIAHAEKKMKTARTLANPPVNLAPGEEWDSDHVWSNVPGREHIKPAEKLITCPNCNWVGEERVLNATWDWAGPHCPNCGQTGFEMLAAVIGPIVSGKQVLNHMAEQMKKML